MVEKSVNNTTRFGPDMETIALTGFFGSGKTTLLILLARHFLREKRKVAILQNEIGKVGVDDLRLEADGYPVEELLGGCICCSLQTNLAVTIGNILEDHAPDILLLEASGLATPDMLRTILENVNRDSGALTFLSVLDAARLRKIENYLDLPFIANAIKTADLVVLNKVEQVEPAKLATLREQAAQTNGRALLAETALRECRELPPLLKLLISGRIGRQPESFTHAANAHGHGHHEHVHGDPVVTSRQRILPPGTSIGPDQLRIAMARFTEQLRQAGTPLIGHVKVFLEDHSGHYLQANATDLSGDCTVDGSSRLDGTVTCTVNAIAYGISNETLDRLVDQFVDSL
jgi:G3E family GTPase